MANELGPIGLKGQNKGKTLGQIGPNQKQALMAFSNGGDSKREKIVIMNFEKSHPMRICSSEGIRGVSHPWRHA